MRTFYKSNKCKKGAVFTRYPKGCAKDVNLFNNSSKRLDAEDKEIDTIKLMLLKKRYMYKQNMLGSCYSINPS